MISRTLRLVPGEDCGKPNMRGALALVGDPASRLCYSIIAGFWRSSSALRTAYLPIEEPPMSSRPEHLFLSDDGNLYDTREPNWATRPLRAGYYGNGPKIETVAELKAALRLAARLRSVAIRCISSRAMVRPSASRRRVKTSRRSLIPSLNGHNDGWRIVGQEINYED